MRLYKYYSLATERQLGYVERAVVRREIHCADASTFNDPFDCNIATHLKGYLKKFGVACFAGEQADHVLMFSHYGDRHRGICLVFDVVDDGAIGDLSFLGLGRHINYVDHDMLPDLSKCDNGSRAHEIVLTKWKKWAYEDEYRVLADLEECDPSPIRRYEPGELVGVIFGLRTPMEHEQAVREWISRSEHEGVWYQKSELAPESFTLTFSAVQE